MLAGMSKSFIWVTSTLGGLGKTSLSAALWRLSMHGMLPKCQILDLDSSPRLGSMNGSTSDVWRSNTERARGLIETMLASESDVVIINFPAGSADLLREVPDERYLRRLGKQRRIAQVHFVDPSAATNEVYLAFNENNALYASATAHFAVVPEHRMSPSANLPNPLPWEQYVDATLNYPSWGITQPSDVVSAVLEGRDTSKRLVELVLDMWLADVAEAFSPLITWLDSEKLRNKNKKEPAHE